MSAQSEKKIPTLGFLTVVSHPQSGLFGGLLVLNLAGRPLEFHLTAPVKANRAQEILYGPTLKPYLYGEQIGGALLAKLKTPALAICTDCADAMSIRDVADVPVVWIPAEEDETAAETVSEVASGSASAVGETNSVMHRFDTAHDPFAAANERHWVHFNLSGRAASVHQRHAEDQRQVESLWRDANIEIDLWEPFARIREAIDEAQAVAR